MGGWICGGWRPVEGVFRSQQHIPLSYSCYQYCRSAGTHDCRKHVHKRKWTRYRADNNTTINQTFSTNAAEDSWAVRRSRLPCFYVDPRSYAKSCGTTEKPTATTRRGPCCAYGGTWTWAPPRHA